MLSGALGLQILVRRLGVELGEQQFAFVDGYDSRELTSKEIKEISKKHSIVCRGLKTDLNGFSEVNFGKQSKLELSQLQEFESKWSQHKIELENVSRDFPNLNRAMI